MQASLRRVQPRRCLITPCQPRIAGDYTMLAFKRDAFVDRVVKAGRRAIGRSQFGPALAAIVGLVDCLGETDCISMRWVQEIHFQNPLLQTFQFFPGLSAVRGGPDAASGGHPTQGSVEEE